MLRAFLGIVTISIPVLSGCAPRVPAPSTSPAHAPSREQPVIASIDAVLSRPELAPTHVGLAVWSLDRKAWLIDRNADKLFVPASNAKLLVAVAALRTFGPATRFRTSVLTDAAQNGAAGDSVLTGNLYLVGGGNPDLSTGDVVELAERLRALGIRRVRGNLVLDASHFDSVAYGPGWMWDEGPYAYNAPVSAFMLNGNTVRLTIRPGKAVGDTVRVSISPPTASPLPVVRATTRSDTTSGSPLSVLRQGNPPVTAIEGSMQSRSGPVVVTCAIPDPVPYAASVFSGALGAAGIVLEGSSASGAAPDSGVQVLAAVSSAPTDVLVRRFLKESDNLLGEALVKQLGRAANGEGSWRSGLAAIRRCLAEFAGVDSTTYRLADGSGLSRYTEVSPRMIVQVMARACDEFTVAPEFLSALAVGGIDGTLARRLTDTDVAGYVRGKTGTMSGVGSLSGVVVTRDGERLAFALLMNGFVGPSAQLRRAQDDVVRALRCYPAPRSCLNAQ